MEKKSVIHHLKTCNDRRVFYCDKCNKMHVILSHYNVYFDTTKKTLKLTNGEFHKSAHSTLRKSEEIHKHGRIATGAAPECAAPAVMHRGRSRQQTQPMVPTLVQLLMLIYYSSLSNDSNGVSWPNLAL